MTTITLHQDISAQTNDKSAFTEQQTFMNTLVIAMLSTLVVVPGCIIGLHIVNGGEISSWWPMVFLGAIPLLLMLSLRLTISIDQTGISYRYFPFIRTRHIAFADLQSISLQTYDPLTDYGGWGLKWGAKGWSYSVYGDDCLLLTFQDGHHILLGIQQKDQWREALKRFAPDGLATETRPDYSKFK